VFLFVVVVREERRKGGRIRPYRIVFQVCGARDAQGNTARSWGARWWGGVRAGRPSRFTGRTVNPTFKASRPGRSAWATGPTGEAWGPGGGDTNPLDPGRFAQPAQRVGHDAPQRQTPRKNVGSFPDCWRHGGGRPEVQRHLSCWTPLAAGGKKKGGGHEAKASKKEPGRHARETKTVRPNPKGRCSNITSSAGHPPRLLIPRGLRPRSGLPFLAGTGQRSSSSYLAGPGDRRHGVIGFASQHLALACLDTN